MGVNSEEIYKKIPTNSFEYYLSLIGINGKRLPNVNEMPKSFYLTGDITSALWNALAITTNKGREVNVSLFVKNGLIKPSSYIIGSEYPPSVPLGGMYRKRLADIHTHPGMNDPGFSNHDMAVFYSNPHEGYLFISISNGGISVLARTQETAKIPFSSTIKTIMEDRYLRGRNKVDTSLAERGYIYYEWENTSRTFHLRGNHGAGVNITNPLEYNQIKGGVKLIKKDIKLLG